MSVICPFLTQVERWRHSKQCGWRQVSISQRQQLTNTVSLLQFITHTNTQKSLSEVRGMHLLCPQHYTDCNATGSEYRQTGGIHCPCTSTQVVWYNISMQCPCDPTLNVFMYSCFAPGKSMKIFVGADWDEGMKRTCTNNLQHVHEGNKTYQTCL